LSSPEVQFEVEMCKRQIHVGQTQGTGKTRNDKSLNQGTTSSRNDQNTECLKIGIF